MFTRIIVSLAVLSLAACASILGPVMDVAPYLGTWTGIVTNSFGTVSVSAACQTALREAVPSEFQLTLQIEEAEHNLAGTATLPPFGACSVWGGRMAPGIYLNPDSSCLKTVAVRCDGIDYTATLGSRAFTGTLSNGTLTGRVHDYWNFTEPIPTGSRASGVVEVQGPFTLLR